MLLVDDEDDLVETLAERLEIRDINAAWVTSGEEALEKMAEEQYDIAILDVKLPGINGITLKKLMEQKNPRMKFIFMTGHGSEADFRAGSMEAGAEYYLIKPVNIDELIKKINEVMVEGGEDIR